MIIVPTANTKADDREQLLVCDIESARGQKKSEAVWIIYLFEDLSSMIDKGETKKWRKLYFRYRGDGKLEICQYSDGAGNVHSAIHDIPTEKSCGKAHRSCWVPMKVMWHFAENTIKKGNCGSEITSGSREEYDAPKPDKSKHLIWPFLQ